MSDDLYTIEIDGVEQEATLEQIADFDASEIEANFGSFKRTPPCTAVWRITGGEIEPKGDTPTISVKMQCEKCYAVVSDEYNEETFVGMEHEELFWIRDLRKDLGKCKGFAEKVLALSDEAPEGSPRNWLEQLEGKTFVAKITHGRNKKDPDNPYVNMDYKKIKSQAKFEAALES